MADFVFGGAGRDVLIANTASDQLFDWSHDFNTYVASFTGKGEHVIVDNPDRQTQQLLIDMALADGADPTRGGSIFRNGEPYGELGLVINGDVDWAAQNGQPRDPVLILKQRDDDGRRDDGSIAFLAAPGPAASLWKIDSLQGINADAKALLHRIVLRGQLTAAERLALPPNGTIALQQLVTAGYVVITNGVGFVTDQTWIALDLAEPPTITSRTTLLGPNVTVFGRGDAGDTIRILDGTSLVAIDDRRPGRHVARDLRPHARPARPVGDADDQRAAARRACAARRRRSASRVIANTTLPTVSVDGDRRAGRRGRLRPARLHDHARQNPYPQIVINLSWTGTAAYGTDFTVAVTGGTLSANGLQLTLAADTDTADARR